jgi:hypothetical protein
MKKRSSYLVMFCILSGVLAATCFSVFAAESSLLEEVIKEKISERHPTDTPSWWRSLGSEAPKVMISLYDQESGIYQRLRLVEALGWFNDPEAIAFLKKQSENASQDVIRNGAIRAVGNAAGASEVEFIGKFLDHEDPQTRVAAGQALRKFSDPQAVALLRKFYDKESLPWVKDRVRDTAAIASRAQGPLLRIESKSPVVLSAGLGGSWKGILVLPSLRDSSLLRVETSAKTRIEGTTSLKGEVTFQLPAVVLGAMPTPGPGMRTITLELSQVSGKDRHVSGWLKGDVLKEWGAKDDSVHFEAELEVRGDAQILKIESREILLNLIFRREGAQ